MYKAGTQAVTSADWTVIDYGKIFNTWSVFPVDGDILVEIKEKDTKDFGDSIYGYSGVGMGDEYPGLALRVKAVTGTVNISYYLTD